MYTGNASKFFWRSITDTLREERKWNHTKLKPVTVHTAARSRCTDSQAAGAGEVMTGEAVPAWV